MDITNMSTMTKVDAYKLLNQLSDHAIGKADDSLVHISGPEGQPRTITEATGDRIKGLFTWTAPGRDVAANNATRNWLATALMTIFDATDLKGLPPKVQEELKVGKFDGTGRPLSVRRIKAVMGAARKETVYQTAEKSVLDQISNGASADQKAKCQKMLTGLSENTIKNDLGVDLEMAKNAKFRPLESYDNGNFVLFDMEGGNGATAKVAVDRNGNLCKVQRTQDGGSYEFVRSDGEVLSTADYKFDVSLGNVSVPSSSFKAIRGALSPLERNVLEHLASLMNDEEFGDDPTTSILRDSFKSSMVNLFFDAVKTMRKEQESQPTQDNQESFAAVWKRLGLEGEAPSLEDQNLKPKFISALKDRVAADICGLMKDGCTLDEVKNTMPKLKSDQKDPASFDPKVMEINGHLKNLGAIGAGPYSTALKRQQNPGYMPSIDDLFIKPTGSKVSEVNLERVGSGDDSILAGVNSGFSNYIGNSKRYINAQISIGGGDSGITLDITRSRTEVCKQYEAAMKAKGCTDAQIVRSITLLNDMNFFADLDFKNLTNTTTVITPMDDGKVRVRHEVPMEGNAEGNAFDEVIIEKDGSYRMDACGKTA